MTSIRIGTPLRAMRNAVCGQWKPSQVQYASCRATMIDSASVTAIFREIRRYCARTLGPRSTA